ncbi:Kelch repeat-containing protein, partial [Paraconexibacter sp.]|uniref:Kelch repeat-containing protein n=1 Tax=Paraconexibacter sp. TaxID=2949640 RepID=UPI00356448CD
MHRGIAAPGRGAKIRCRRLTAVVTSCLLIAIAATPAHAGTFTPTGSLVTGRIDHTATLLPDGKVLIVGGFRPNSYEAAAELYDPSTGTFAPTGSLNTARGNHTATLLPSGKVLITGGHGVTAAGNSFDTIASAELYDPATGAFTVVGPLGQARRDHTATLLPSGKVLVTGG